MKNFALDVVTAIENGETDAAQSAFQSLIRDKVTTALDIKKIALTSEIFVK